MPAPLTTKPQVNGYRFIIRRMEHALVRRDVRMLHEPMRGQARSLLVGGVLAALVMAGFGIAAWISPAPDVGDSAIILAEDSGALYVRVEGERVPGRDASVAVDAVLHPALNLASARLVAGESADPERVPDDHLPDTRRGAVVGIPGAPQRLPDRSDQVSGPWTVCDMVERGTAARTGVLVGDLRTGERSTILDDGDAVLVESDGQTYLLVDGHRARVDPSDPGVARALGIGGLAPVHVSDGLIGALPAGPRMQAPVVDGAGEVARYPVGGARVGDVLRFAPLGRSAAQSSAGQSRDEHSADQYLVLRDGLQRVPAVVAGLVAYGGPPGTVREVRPDEIANAPTARHPVPLDGFPDGRVSVRVETPEVLCASWQARGDGDGGGRGGSWRVIAGDSLPTELGDSAVHLVGADGAGPAADLFVMRPGSAAHVRSSHTGGAAQAGGPRFLVDDAGIRYGIPDADTSRTLGLGADTDAAPWEILGLLPAGPALTSADAQVTHDGISPDPAPEALLAGG